MRDLTAQEELAVSGGWKWLSRNKNTILGVAAVVTVAGVALVATGAGAPVGVALIGAGVVTGAGVSQA